MALFGCGLKKLRQKGSAVAFAPVIVAIAERINT